MKKVIKVGSRESQLAIIQSTTIINEIKKNHPDTEIKLVTMKTTGDLILDKSLDKIGGKGLFVKELDRALLNREIDLAVHSLKDMPMKTPENLPILALSQREDERDVLILPKGDSTWDQRKPVGCSSFRRKIQLKRLYKKLSIKGIRGNVITRLDKLDNGEYGALVLAAAGIKRLGLEERIHRYFSIKEILPSAGQGVLAIQGRSDMKEYTKCLQHWDVNLISKCEREFVRYLDGGCSSPVAAHGRIAGNKITLTGLYYEELSGSYIIGEKTREIEDALGIGVELADELREKE